MTDSQASGESRARTELTLTPLALVYICRVVAQGWKRRVASAVQASKPTDPLLDIA
jgi:hypothetical protein